MEGMSGEYSAERVEVLSGANNYSGSWIPKVGDETFRLQRRLDLAEHSWQQIRREALSILSKCTPPEQVSGSVTGLVTGYVQSGKTMSFTTVAALAKDNGYQLVILIAGTSLNLLEQSTSRLKSDLQLDKREERRWKHFETKSIRGDGDIETLARDIKNTLSNWRDPKVPSEERRTILITVMKQYQHLNKLKTVLGKVANIGPVPTLIIDDEADQRSLNTDVNNDSTSTTYESMVALKNSLPHHSFLQYTATPQAPLLINIIDTLSPKFVQVLTPGDGYVGGKEFFLIYPDFVKSIPFEEIPTKEYSLQQPPDSLMLALSIFYLGVAAGLIKRGKGNRSMLVHPSHKTIPHKLYYDWINLIIKRWQLTLELDESDPDKQDLIDEFRDAYAELTSTPGDFPSFKELVERLPQAIRETSTREINSREGQTPSVDWENEYGHILIGGQSMDRGFTIEGLTVTYMPRGKGLGNADTIQQRARFFGYKKAYLQYCRVFLDEEVRDSFRNYVIHEEDIRQRLAEFSETNESLSAWKRAFFLSAKLKPCRDNVIDLDYIRGNFRESWYTPKAPHDSGEAVSTNRTLLKGIIEQLTFREDDGHRDRTEEQKHWIAPDISLLWMYQSLLVPFKVSRYGDSERYTGLLLQIGAILDQNPDALCTFYQMSKGNLRSRSLSEKDEIKNLYQSYNPKSGTRIYPGDQRIVAHKQVTIQYHNLRLTGDNGQFDNVPTLAIYVPREIGGGDWLVQSSRPKARRSKRK